MKQLMILFEDGGLTDPTVSRSNDRGYHLHFERRNGSREYVTKYVRSADRVEDSRRIFKSIDGAAQAAKQIGFEEVKVNLDGVEDMKQPRVPKTRMKNPA